jgi:hypothetical protein
MNFYLMLTSPPMQVLGASNGYHVAVNTNIQVNVMA